MKTETKRHWTPKSGFFPCKAEVHCPKSSEHFSMANKTSQELKSSYVNMESIARSSMLNGEITPREYGKAVNQARKETNNALKKLKRVPKKKAYTTAIGRGTAVLAGGAILAGSLTGCGVTVAELPDKTADKANSQSVLDTLDSSDSIELKKSAISIGDNWTVKAGGSEISSVKGQAIAVLGDTYSMFTPEGNLVGSEAEKTATVMQAATMYDYDNNERGSIDRNITPILQKYTIKDGKGNVVGTAEQKFSIGMKFDVKDANGEVEYTVSKALVSIGDSVSIEKKVEKADVQAQDAIWVSLMANEINAAQDEKNNSNNNR
jgi:uncharacterized protein YxjI